MAEQLLDRADTRTTVTDCGTDAFFSGDSFNAISIAAVNSVVDFVLAELASVYDIVEPEKPVDLLPVATSSTLMNTLCLHIFVSPVPTGGVSHQASYGVYFPIY